MNLYIFDGTALVYRAFYALPSMTTSDGKPTNAVFGLTKMLVKFVHEHLKPDDYVVFVLDTKEKTFRHTLFEDYKANRAGAPDDMIIQLPYVEKLVKALGISVVKQTGFEADDVIATLAKKYSKDFEWVYVITGDKDLLQLVGKNIRVLRFASMGVTDLVEYDENKVVKRYGVMPSQMGDFLSLVGDSSDNIPGVKGIGEKSAVNLLKEYGTLDAVYEHLDEIQTRYKKLLSAGKDNAFLSKKLVELSDNIHISISFKPYKGPNKAELAKLFDELEFSNLKKEFGLYEDAKTRSSRYFRIKSLEELDKELDKVGKSGRMAFDTETTSLSPVDAKLVGISFSSGECSYYVPVGHSQSLNLPLKEVILRFKKLLEDEHMKIIGQNIKYDIAVMKKYGVNVKPYFDTMIAAYLLNPNGRRFSLDQLAMKYLGYKTVSYGEVTGKSGDFSSVPVDIAARYSAEDSDVTYRLYETLNKKMYESDLTDVFYKVEMPLVEVLATMELNGVYIDTSYLKEISNRYSKILSNIEKNIYELAGGMPFNINSPKQVSDVLFKRLNLKPRHRTKTRAFSTNASVLEEMKDEHPIIPLLLEYRKYFKLKSTYLDAMPKMVNPKTSRVHSSFNQTGTSTGRLSSSDPNLQNIPARNEEGREIRKAIRAQKEGWVIMSSDYSQIELRVLAHVSEDPALIKAFEEGVDIHTATAARVYGVSEDSVTDQMRRVGKMVNFAVTYGVSAYGLAKRLGIERADAERVITNYFQSYPKVREYLENTVTFAKEKGYVKTILGRRRDVLSIRSNNHNISEEGKRMAINAPIQGSAADIIKLAMIKVHELLKKYRAMMILQVHDELVFELPIEEIEEVKKLVKNSMEGIIKLKVPLVVDVEVGSTW